MKKVFVISYSKMNLGDDLFVDMLLKKYPNCEFYSRSISTESSVYNDNDNLHFLDYDLDDLLRQDVSEFDAFIYIGGSIFMEKAGGIKRVKKIKELTLKCKCLGIPFYFVSSNFGPYENKEYLDTVKEIFSNSKDVCLRDKYSYETFKNIPTVRYAPDLVFSYKPAKVVKEKKTLGISLINFKYREELEKYQDTYYDTLVKTIKHYIKEGYKIKLFSFCKYEGDEDSFDIILDKIQDKENISKVKYNGNLKKFIEEYSKTEYMICSRFHSMVLSCLAMQNMYILSYSDKINNVVKDLNITSKVSNIKKMTSSTAIKNEKFVKSKIDSEILKESKKQLAMLDEFLLNDVDIEEKITVIIPARNEEKYISKVVRLVQKNQNVDQILVVDNASSDDTAKLAKSSGAEVIRSNKIGKGYAMEEGLKHARNDIVVFIDADISNYSKDLITKLTDPIIYRRADFVKSMFDRTGGRVTELVAKPLLAILFPNMHEFSQPLSGMIAGRRDIFYKLEFEKDYGVDIGILLDVINLGVNVQEVHVGKIKNVSQRWQALEKMAKEVMSAIIKRANY